MNGHTANGTAMSLVDGDDNPYYPFYLDETYPVNVKFDFRKTSMESLQRYCMMYKLRVRPNCTQGQLAVAVARHFEDWRVPDEEVLFNNILKKMSDKPIMRRPPPSQMHDPVEATHGDQPPMAHTHPSMCPDSYDGDEIDGNYPEPCSPVAPWNGDGPPHQPGGYALPPPHCTSHTGHMSSSAPPSMKSSAVGTKRSARTGKRITIPKRDKSSRGMPGGSGGGSGGGPVADFGAVIGPGGVRDGYRDSTAPTHGSSNGMVMDDSVRVGGSSTRTKKRGLERASGGGGGGQVEGAGGGRVAGGRMQATKKRKGGGGWRAKNNEEVAVKDNRDTSNKGSWILGRVVKYIPEQHHYLVRDDAMEDNNGEDSEIFAAPRPSVVRLVEGTKDVSKGDEVLAVYPATSVFYKGIVHKTNRGPNCDSKSVDIIFCEEDGSNGTASTQTKSLYMLTKEMYQQGDIAAEEEEAGVQKTDSEGEQPDPVESSKRSRGVSKERMYADLIHQAMDSMNKETATFDTICKYLQMNFKDELNWNGETVSKRTPIWKTAVKRVLESHPAFNKVDKNTYALASS